MFPKRGLKDARRLAYTVMHLRPVQIYERVRRLVAPAVPDQRPPPGLRSRTGKFIYSVRRSKKHDANTNVFCALNIARSIAEDSVWNDSVAPKLWLYNLHYFDDLAAEGAEHRHSEHAELISRWINENPPGWGAGWEPYPISLRAVNWIKWALSGGQLSEQALHSLAVQIRFLASSLEYHLMANHLVANAKALVFAGLFFEGAEGHRWFVRGEQILAGEMKEQILADGGHFELSPTYHAIIIEDVLDLLNVTTTYHRSLSVEMVPIAEEMLCWLAAMTRPDGLPPLFNDAAYGIAPTFAELSIYAARLGVNAPRAVSQPGLIWLEASGYARVTRDRYVLFADLGEIGPSYNPGHGHCDMLSFELAVNGKPVIVDTGTSTYEDVSTRLMERGTAAHNTVQVGRAEQSEIWSAFRVGRRAHIQSRSVNDAVLEGMHNGYASMGVRHTRRFVPGEGEIVIEDLLEGMGAGRTSTARFHLAPEIVVDSGMKNYRAGPITFHFEGADKVEIIQCHYAPEFYKRIPSQCLSASFSNRLRTTITL